MFDRCDHERGASFEGGLALVVDGDHYGVEGDRLATAPLASPPSVFLGRLDGAPLFLTETAMRVETMLPFREAALALAPDDVALLSYAHGRLEQLARHPDVFLLQCAPSRRRERVRRDDLLLCSRRKCTVCSCTAEYAAQGPLHSSHARGECRSRAR